MNIPQFKGDNVEIFNKKTSLYELRNTDMRSLVGLYASEVLLFLGFILILLNNVNVIAPGSYFGAFSWVTVAVFSIGLVINFVSIPFLYFSSFKDFKKDDDFWDKEIFWILPSFFFGTFFLYGSEISFSPIILVFSVVVIALVHLKFFAASRRFLLESSDEALMLHQQYFVSLKYLTVYYLLLLVFLVAANPMQQMFVWIRVHA